MSAAAVAGGLAAYPLPQANSGEPNQDIVVATGVLPEPFDLDDVEVELIPNITDQTEPGPLPTFFVDGKHLSLGDGNVLTVRLSPAEVPTAFRSKRGLVDLKIDASDGVVVWSTILTSQVVSTGDGESQWVDPGDLQQAAAATASRLRFAGRSAVVADGTSVGAEVEALEAPTFASPDDPDYSEEEPPMGDDTWGEGDDDRAGWNQGAAEPRVVGGCPDGGTGPHQTEYLSKKRAWSTIGTSYPVGDSTAWMKVTTSSSNGARYGAGIKYAGVSATASGSAWAEGSWSKTWLAGGASRSYRKEVEYIRVRYYNYLSGPACDHVHWIPNKETGGTAINKVGVTRPDWDEPNRCARQSPGPFERSSSNGNNYEYGAAVKLEEVIGTDLGISRSYSSHQLIRYDIRGTGHWLCGNNAYPSLSGKLMEWRQRPY